MKHNTITINSVKKPYQEVDRNGSGKFLAGSHRMHITSQDICLKYISAWEIDEEFIAKAQKKAKAADLISLDVFDTALTRCYDSPADLFSAVEEKLIAQYGKNAKGFARAREEAEFRARQRLWETRKAQDIQLADIYLELNNAYQFSRCVKDLQKLELDLELESLLPVPDILKLYNIFKRDKKNVVFTSDMYLPRDFLSKALVKNGYLNFDNLFVSSEINKTKATGDIWKHIQLRYPGTNYSDKILHIGDDTHSDVDLPQQHGIATIHYARAKSSRRYGGKLGEGLASTSRWFRLAAIQQHTCVISPSQDEDLEYQAYNLGVRLGGPVVGGFLQWLTERLGRSKPDRIYFLARDGYLLHHLWEHTNIAKSLNLKCKYIFLSRAALNLPAGYLQSTPDHLAESLLEFLCSSTGKVTPSIVFERAGLNAIQSLIEDAREEFRDLNFPLNVECDYHKLRKLFVKHSSQVYEQLKIKYQHVVKYLKQEGLLDDGHFAMVDLGWHASMQASLQQIIKSAGGASTLYGYYYGLWPAAERNRFKAGFMESFFSSPQLPFERQRAIHWGVPYLEQLHGAPYGTTLGYTSTRGEMIPVLQHSPEEVRQHAMLTQHFQRGVRDAVLSMTRLGIKFDRDAAIAAMGSVFLSPSDSELNVLKMVGHCATFDHKSQESILHHLFPEGRDEQIALLDRSESPILQLKLWFKHLSEHQRELVRSLAAARLETIDPRLMRQFQ